jgi:hypothetical protein
LKRNLLAFLILCAALVRPAAACLGPSLWVVESIIASKAHPKYLVAQPSIVVQVIDYRRAGRGRCWLRSSTCSSVSSSGTADDDR